MIDILCRQSANWVGRSVWERGLYLARPLSTLYLRYFVIMCANESSHIVVFILLQKMHGFKKGYICCTACYHALTPSVMCTVRLLYSLVRVVRVVNCSFSRHCYWSVQDFCGQAARPQVVSWSHSCCSLPQMFQPIHSHF